VPRRSQQSAATRDAHCQGKGGIDQEIAHDDALSDSGRWLCEWTKSPTDDGRDPWHIHLPEHQPFSFAGLWAHNNKLGVTSCTIITAPAVKPVSQIHDRMPVILDQAAYDAWSSTSAPKQVLSQNLNGKLEFYCVGRQVNSSADKEREHHDGPF
jgi:putative SOS response-associated peptidase YedK